MAGGGEYQGAWIGVGLALGAALGAAFGNVAIGAALGLLFGVCVMPVLSMRQKTKDPDPPAEDGSDGQSPS